MKKPSDQSPGIGPGRTGDTTRPGKDTPPFTKSERVQDPKETAQEAVHQVTARKDVIKTKDDVKQPPLHAAKGNDEVMSQPPSRNQP